MSRLLRRTLVLVALSICAAMLLAPPASAKTCERYPDNRTFCAAGTSEYPQWKGWVTLIGCGSTIFPRGYDGWEEDWQALPRCVWIGSRPAWKYTYPGWSETTITNGQDVYVYPWTGSWRWVWFGGDWYAMRTQDLTIGWWAS